VVNAMTEMVTRVARAMAEAAGFAWENCAQPQWERDARAAIEAMREPTVEMLAAVYPVLGIPPTPIYANAYRIMVGAALNIQQRAET
jgi:hypothetical protein